MQLLGRGFKSRLRHKNDRKIQAVQYVKNVSKWRLGGKSGKEIAELIDFPLSTHTFKVHYIFLFLTSLGQEKP